MEPMTNPTGKTYGDFQLAYDHFNYRLFSGELPDCLITMQRKSKAYGYFAGARFKAQDEQGGAEGTIDEIALNPTHFKRRSTEQVLSTLVHEMVHLWQHHYGKPSPQGYHNKQWAVKMLGVGLTPSDTGAVGGKQTGHRVTHFITYNGIFSTVCGELTDKGFVVPVIDLWDEEEGKKAVRKIKAASKSKYTCPACGLNVWGKPEIKVICGECIVPMESDSAGDAD